jgi:DNA-directed RNA polymerase subunit H (RpoH/RPB5)
MADTPLFDPSVVDVIVRSRQTTLDILEDRGYDTTPYRNIAVEQLLTFIEGGKAQAMDMYVNKRPDSNAPCERAVVVYQLINPIRLRLGTFTRDIYTIAQDNSADRLVNKTDDVIVVINEPYHEAFDKASMQLWQQYKARMTFFHIKQLVVHLGRHVLVPPHRKLSPEEAKEEMARLRVTQRSQLPLIKYHDIQARILGLVPGDMVEILRPSPTAGVARVLRICAA